MNSSEGRAMALPAAPATTVRDLSRWLLVGLGVLGAMMVARWSVVWRESPDFAHGWIVPVFAAYLAWERRLDRPAIVTMRGEGRIFWWSVFGLGAVAMLGGRLLLEPFSTWPSALWLFSVGGWAMAGALIAQQCGPATTRHFAFPILFTATALPWPGVIDVHVILPLRAVLASIAAEVIHACGYPAIAQGTVIEVGRGQVGIDEACSGVRSLQAAIMIALLLGEVFRLRWPRRIWLLLAALGLALLSNLGRTCFLAWQGARHGPAGVASWHDIAGALQMITALGGMAWLAWRWRHHAAEVKDRGFPQSNVNGAGIRGGVIVLIVVVAAIEGGTRAWFSSDPAKSIESHWSARLPQTQFSFRPSPFTPGMQSLLQCDIYQSGQWESAVGERRAGYVLDWNRGHAARQSVALHNPEICLPYSGQRFVASRGTVTLNVNENVSLDFRLGEFTGGTGTFYVFYVAWDLDHARSLVPADDDGAERWFSYRLNAVRSRQSEFSARVVALAFYDVPDLETAKQRFMAEAPNVITNVPQSP